MTSVSEPAPAPSVNDASRAAGASDLGGARIWVTGASRGLGRAIAVDLSRAGAKLALTARTEGALDGVHDECGADRALRVAGSVADAAEVAAITETIRQRWGGLDALVHCAGISPTFDRGDDLTPAAWREIVEVNLTGTFLVCQAAATLMGTGASIVTVSSVHARSAGRRLAAYSATKGGVEALTRSLALDWAQRGIRVNCIAPGYFETDMTNDLRNSEYQRNRLLARIPLGTLGQPSQIVDVVRLLVGPGSSYITGSVIAIDGGWTAA
ncbi:NAD(P)-dependent dehydrogenase, short-chain alcohol dehydrogenase family [Micromonospora pallida]|uniref:NAD(P)-dependent dehydrogenase, short-chain alcohol dehydrogenase family n=1 Tax=Micromonospora pallida TaxID=145854 RepID=A0A1C6RSG6_9ACTN|nr:SDR family NAD(P)-dependent oxidoreductase [Micromonospora pallida]SCL20098.1 NAD(P)-dependent dehydrogenase, short-chain alcohol dehydrogenase family [Micromonospora pallida]